MTDEHGMQATIRESLDFFLSGRILNGQISTDLDNYSSQTGRLNVEELMNKHVYPETDQTWDDMEETIFHAIDDQMVRLGIFHDFRKIYQNYNNENKKTFIKNRVKKYSRKIFSFSSTELKHISCTRPPHLS
jgi:t-SNARE complex subunit (syntaxin)